MAKMGHVANAVVALGAIMSSHNPAEALNHTAHRHHKTHKHHAKPAQNSHAGQHLLASEPQAFQNQPAPAAHGRPAHNALSSKAIRHNDGASSTAPIAVDTKGHGTRSRQAILDGFSEKSAGKRSGAGNNDRYNAWRERQQAEAREEEAAWQNSERETQRITAYQEQVKSNQEDLTWKEFEGPAKTNPGAKKSVSIKNAYDARAAELEVRRTVDMERFLQDKNTFPVPASVGTHPDSVKDGLSLHAAGNGLPMEWSDATAHTVNIAPASAPAGIRQETATVASTPERKHPAAGAEAGAVQERIVYRDPPTPNTPRMIASGLPVAPVDASSVRAETPVSTAALSETRKPAVVPANSARFHEKAPARTGASPAKHVPPVIPEASPTISAEPPVLPAAALTEEASGASPTVKRILSEGAETAESILARVKKMPKGKVAAVAAGGAAVIGGGLWAVKAHNAKALETELAANSIG